MAKKKLTKTERAEMEARHERMLANARGRASWPRRRRQSWTQNARASSDGCLVTPGIERDADKRHDAFRRGRGAALA